MEPFSDNHFNRINDSNSTESIAPYDLENIRRQFKKKFYQDFEPRFVIILLCSLLLHTTLALYLSTHLQSKIKLKSIEKVRQQFVNLLLQKKDDVFEKPKIDESGDLLSLIQSTSLEISGLFAEETRTPRDLKTKAKRSRETLSEEVQHKGLFGIITSRSGLETYPEIVDILEFADSTAGDLEQKLAFLISLRAYDGKTGFPGLMTNSKIVSKPLSIKETRAYTENIYVEDMFEKLGDVKTIPVNKTEIYEEIPSPLVSLRSKPTKVQEKRLSREPIEVRNMVLSHYPAIQDCYTQALKNNPNLKGKVVVRFVVSPKGRVISASIVSSSINDEQMIECILVRILKWNDFSELHPSAGNMAFKQPYLFGIK